MSGVVFTVIAVIYAALLAFYCVLEKRDNFWHATTVKLTLSAFAAGLSVYGAIRFDEFFLYIFALGLLFAVPADYCLQYIKTNLTKYRVGITLFGLMHICLITSFYLIHHVYFYEFVIFAVLLAIVLAFQIIGKWEIGKEKAQLNVYTVIVLFMSAKTMSIFIVEPAIYTLVLAIGGLLFFVSDVFLGIWAYSGKNTYVNLVLNRATYFLALFCLATWPIIGFLYFNDIPTTCIHTLK